MNKLLMPIPVTSSDKGARTTPQSLPPVEFGVALLTGGQDRPYAFSLAMGLVAQGIALDVIGSDEVDSPEMHATPGLRFLNLRGSQRPDVSRRAKILRLLTYYFRLIRYAAGSGAAVFHILWNNKFEYFDRTLLLLYYRLLGKKLVLTAHNVNAARRDNTDSLLNRLTLRMQYRLASHIFVHTEKMKSELMLDFGVPAQAISVLIHPINDAFPDTDLTPAEAKHRLGIHENERTLLFYGRLVPYKGLEYLVEAFLRIAGDSGYRLIIAGEPKKGAEEYMSVIRRLIAPGVESGSILAKCQFIPDEETEVYCKAADAMVLPYKEIFQSGVLFLAYAYGLPVIATDVGSFRETIREGQTGFICRPGDVADLARTIEKFFGSDLYRDLNPRRRQELKDYAFTHHSWDAAARMTRNAYLPLVGRPS